MWGWREVTAVDLKGKGNFNRVDLGIEMGSRAVIFTSS